MSIGNSINQIHILTKRSNKYLANAEQMSLNRINHTCSHLDSIRDQILTELYKVTDLSEIDSIVSLVSDSIEEIRTDITVPFRNALIDTCQEVIDNECQIDDMQRDYDELERNRDNLIDEIDDLNDEISNLEGTIREQEQEISDLS